MTLDSAFKSVSTGRNAAAGWETIYTALTPRLIAYVSSLLLTFRIPSTTAPDVVQDAFLSLLQRWKQSDRPPLASVTEMERYLKTTCRNLIVDRYRHDRTADTMLNFFSLSFNKAFESEAATYRAVFVDEIIHKLPPECGRILQRYVAEDIAPVEIADSEDIPIATFYSRWYRCLQKARVFITKPAPAAPPAAS